MQKRLLVFKLSVDYPELTALNFTTAERHGHQVLLPLAAPGRSILEWESRPIDYLLVYNFFNALWVFFQQ